MVIKLIFLLLLCHIPMKAENNVWRFVKADVYKVSYNVFIEQWLKERTSEIKVLNVSINEETGRAKLLFENASNSIVMFGLMDLSYYRIYSNHRKEELVNDENVISVGYVIEPGKNVVFPFSLSVMDSDGLFLVNMRLAGDNVKYDVKVYLRRIDI